MNAYIFDHENNDDIKIVKNLSIPFFHILISTVWMWRPSHNMYVSRGDCKQGGTALEVSI